MIVFGSEYRTAPGHRQAGHLRPQTAARRAGGDRRRPGGAARPPLGQRQHRRRDRRGRSDAARQTAESLAAALGATVVEYGAGPVDLLVVGSRPESPQGKVTLSASSDYAVEAATYPVLVVPRGVALSFAAAPQPQSGLCLTTGSRPRPRGRGRRSAFCAAGQLDRPRLWPATIRRAASGLRPSRPRSRTRRRSGGGAPASSISRVTSVAGARRLTSPGRRRGRAAPAAAPRGS